MKHFSQKFKLATLAVIVIFLTFGIKRLYDLARSPLAPKPCLFTFPTLENTTTTLMIAPPAWLTQKAGFINDASCLNRTPIYGVVEVKNENDVAQALEYAQQNNLKVTAAGQKHSMGGQAFQRNGLVLDMRHFNHIKVDRENKIAHVQSGATWEELQKIIDPLGLSIKAMQSINIFTIGGTLSVNAHGIAHNPGPVASTVRSLRVMTPDGSIIKASPTENTDLFQHVLGGYGLFGVILEAEIELVENKLYDWNTTFIPYTDFPTYFEKNIANNSDIELFFARLSMSPTSYLTETAVHTFSNVNLKQEIPAVKPIEPAFVQRLIFNLSKTGGAGKWLRWNLEKHIAKKLAPCIVSRTDALMDPYECLMARNQAMYDSMPYLKNELRDTDILQEYFVSPEQFPDFVDGLKNIVQKNDVNLLNVTIRYVHKDEVTALPYAKKDMFALVLYFNQRLEREDSEKLQQTTRELIDLVNSQGGTYYLPYQLYYSSEQLQASYPEIDQFFEKKTQYDPQHIFTNTWFEKYFSEKF